MNSSVYIFGNLSSGYTQYPDEDFTASIFKKCMQSMQATTQIVIHRNGDLMYYIYLRELEENRCIGICVLLNGVMITKLDSLFSIFENTISTLAEKGYFIGFDENGNLVSISNALSHNSEEIDIISDSLKRAFNNLESSAKSLPSVNYSVSNSSVQNFTIKDSSDEILKSSYTNGYTFIYKSDGYETAQTRSYKGVLARITNENKSLKDENSNLKSENKRILKQKKQFQYVLLLLIGIALCCLGLFSLNDNLKQTKGLLADANETIDLKNSLINIKNEEIEEKKDSIKHFKSNISSLTKSLKEANEQKQEIEIEYEDFRTKISNAIPILINEVQIANTEVTGVIINGYGSSIYSTNTKYLTPRIKYYGLKAGANIILDVKLYLPNGTLSQGSNSPNGYTYKTNMIVNSGANNEYTLSGWGGTDKGHWGKGSYRYEIWYGNKCLGSRTFTIY